MGSEFEDLEALLELMEEFLLRAADPNPKHWFPNNMGAHSLLLRAYQGLQASANLCALGFYRDSTAVLRTVYEATGLARTLAHKTELAERWLHGGDWVKDKISRDFADEMRSDTTSTDSPSPHWTHYQTMSQYAHPLARSVLSLLFTREGKYQPDLSPDFDADWCKETARIITYVGLFVAFTCRNAMADFDALPPSWHQALAELARKISGQSLEHLNDDWAARQERYKALTSQVRHTEELNDALDADPDSLRNRVRRVADHDDKT